MRNRMSHITMDFTFVMNFEGLGVVSDRVA